MDKESENRTIRMLAGNSAGSPIIPTPGEPSVPGALARTGNPAKEGFRQRSQKGDSVQLRVK
jgi:hypothetical protein